MPPDNITHLGEIVISYQQAELQAGEHRHPLFKELALLLIHGVLHLIGYDHMEPDEEKAMKELEVKTMSKIEIPRDSRH